VFIARFVARESPKTGQRGCGLWPYPGRLRARVKLDQDEVQNWLSRQRNPSRIVCDPPMWLAAI
jgi:hypothetical protein